MSLHVPWEKQQQLQVKNSNEEVMLGITICFKNSNEEIMLGITIDNKLTFDSHKKYMQKNLKKSLCTIDSI